MNVHSFIASFSYALRGLRYVYTHEQNFRIQVWLAIGIICLMYVLDIRASNMLVLLLLITAVLILEVLNSVLEKFVDIVKPRLAYQVQVVKDMMAAMVLIASISSFIMGLIILGPPLVELIGY